MTLGSTEVEVRPPRRPPDALVDLMTLIAEPSAILASPDPQENRQTGFIACQLLLVVGIGNDDFANLLALSKRSGITLIGVGCVHDALAILGLHQPAIILLSREVADCTSQRRVLEATKSMYLSEPYVALCDKGLSDRLNLPKSKSDDFGRDA